MKKNKIKHYWFYIDSYVHISVKNENILLYNPYNGNFLEYSQKPQILKLLKRLQYPKNLQVIKLDETDLEKPIIKEFVQKIREFFMGDLMDMKYSKGKPIQMTPIVKIQKDVKFLKADNIRTVGEKMMEYLTQISLYINNRCSQNCMICRKAYRQFLCCTTGNAKFKELDINHIRNVFEDTKNCSLTNVNILGGNIFDYSTLTNLLSYLNNLDIKKTYFVHYLNAAINRNRIRELIGKNTRLKLPVTFPLDKEKYKAALDAAVSVGLETIPIFIVQCKEEFENAENLLAKYPVSSPIFRAFYNGNNINFMTDSIFIDKDEIEAAHPTLKDIYVNSAINSLNFGKLTILSNGYIYANVNAANLGILEHHNIYDVVFKELKEGKSWRKVRKNVSPCKKCSFEMLCPPISDYSIVMHRYNLCHIWK